MRTACMFRIPECGARVIWQITNACNYRCRYCMFASGGVDIQRELSTSEAMGCIGQLKEAGFTHIKFTGGEPFLRSDLLTLLEHACSSGFAVDVSTNGSRIDAQMAARLAKLNLKMVHVSLDGPDGPVHDSMRGEGTFARTVNAIKQLVSHGIFVRIGTVLFLENQHLIRAMAEMAASLGAGEIIFSIIEPAGRMKGDTSHMISKPLVECAEEIAALQACYGRGLKVSQSFFSRSERIDGCPGGSRYLFIDEIGRVSPCTWAVEYDRHFRAGETLKNARLSQLLESKPIQLFREQQRECCRPLGAIR